MFDLGRYTGIGRLGRNPFGSRGTPAGGGGGGAALEYGVESASGWSNSAWDPQTGWEFQVGGSNIEVSKLTWYALNAYPSGANWTLYLWRVSDQALLGSVAFGTPTVDERNEYDIAPVTLVAGANYIVSIIYGSGSSHNFYVNPSSKTFNAAITRITGRWGYGTAFPASTSAGNHWIAADIGFTV